MEGTLGIGLPWLVSVLLAVITQSGKERVYLVYFTSQSIIEGKSGQEFKAGTKKQRSRSTAYWLAQILF